MRAIQTHHREDIFYAVKACIAMHNMMVELRVSEHQEESSSFYEVVQHQQSAEAPVDSVEAEIDSEDACLYNRAEAGEGNLKNDLVDLDLIERIDRSKFYSRRFRVVQRRWEKLTSSSSHLSLQNAVKTEVYRRQYGEVGDGEDIADFDPLEDF